MKRNILLVDGSLTVQKVVSLTLDKTFYELSFAKSRAEVMQLIGARRPDLILISDQVSDLDVGNFPKEVESWVGQLQKTPAIVLITSHDQPEQRLYAGVLKKPFSPGELQSVVGVHAPVPDEMALQAERAAQQQVEQLQDSELERKFNSSFADEAELVRETFKSEFDAQLEVRSVDQTQLETMNGDNSEATMWRTEPEGDYSMSPSQYDSNLGQKKKPTTYPAQEAPKQNLWETPAEKATQVRRPTPSVQEGAPTERLGGQLQAQLERMDLEPIIERVVSRMLPPIVEKLVQDRLDKLLKEQETDLR